MHLRRPGPHHVGEVAGILAAGLLADGDQPGGGRLVYLGKTGADGATVSTVQLTEDWVLLPARS